MHSLHEEPGHLDNPARPALVEACGLIGEIDLKLCVERATERFGPKQMADGYQSVYERAIQESYHR